jgi:hypothetical protein
MLGQPLPGQNRGNGIPRIDLPDVSGSMKNYKSLTYDKQGFFAAKSELPITKHEGY